MEILGENVRTFKMRTNSPVLFDVFVDPRFGCKTTRKVRGGRNRARRTNRRRRRTRANSHASASSSSSKSDFDVTKDLLKRELFDMFGFSSSSSSSNDINDDGRNQQQQQQRKNAVGERFG